MEQRRQLNLLDAVLIVSSGMIGSGIFIVSADMSRLLGGPGWVLLGWVLSGVITLLAALSYGELAGMYPQAGGQYVYLREAFGPLTGFLYGWTLFVVIQCGTIAAVAVAFAKFTGVLVPWFSEQHILFESGNFKFSAAQLLGIFSIFLLTLFNAQGIRYGQLINRFFTSAKLLALFGLIVLGLVVFTDSSIWQNNMVGFWRFEPVTPVNQGMPLSVIIMSALGVSLVGALFSSDAWNNVTFIAGEIQNPKRNIPLSMLLGTAIVITLYLLVNVAYLKLLPFWGNPDGATVAERGLQFATNDRVGVAAVIAVLGGVGSIIMAVVIMISTFGANNSIALAGARVYQAMAQDGLFFDKMKQMNKNGVPGFALWAQFIWASLLCLSGKYGDLLDYIMFSVVFFYILSVVAIFVLRRKKPELERPYKVWGYPIVPILYILLASGFCINLLFMKPQYSYPGLIIVLLGIPVYFIRQRSKAA